MDRKNFIKKSLFLGGIGAMAPTLWSSGKSTYDKLINNVGFNHLPNKENKTMNTVLHKANTRGNANHGWLDSHHTFSFANYHNPDRMHFGVLRVLNDDTVSAGQGFGKHPHDNMEIISIPLSGDLQHEDSMGNKAVIKNGDVQVLSAGTGVHHSEYNRNADQEVKFLQIWIFPKIKNVTPRYDQISIENIAKKNEFYQVLSPNADDAGVWIHQDAWFHIGDFDVDTNQSYQIKNNGNGLYAFVLEGEAEINGQALETRDGFGVWDVNEIAINAKKGSRILLMDVPMNI